MIVRAYDIEYAHHVWHWRIDSREALRTPYMQSHNSQIEYARWVADHPREVRIWAFMADDDQPYMPLAVGGLQHIEWENGTAELSLIVHPGHRRKGVGWQALNWIFAEAFDRMRLHSVWTETYRCNGAGIALATKALRAFDGKEAMLPHRKYWDGSLWSSRWWAIFEEGWRENSNRDSSTDGVIQTPREGPVSYWWDTDSPLGG